MGMRLLATTLLFAVSLFARAQEAAEPAKAAPPTKTYAAISLISDALEIAKARGETGSHLTSTVTRAALSNPIYDTVALLAIKDVFEKKGVEKPVVLLRSSEKMYAQQGELLDGKKYKGLAGLDSALSASKVTHLLVITKIRENARVKLGGVTIGSGKLQGLGYYLDFNVPTLNSESNEKGQGVIAPYAYFKVSLVDLATSTVTNEVQVMAGYAANSSTQTATADPWSSMSNEEKDKVLRDLVQKEVTKAVASLL